MRKCVIYFRDLHGKSLINFCGSLAIGLAIVVIMKIMAYSNMDLCAVRGKKHYYIIYEIR